MSGVVLGMLGQVNEVVNMCSSRNEGKSSGGSCDGAKRSYWLDRMENKSCFCLISWKM